MDYFIDLNKHYPNIKTKIWKNNDLKNVRAKMVTISTVPINGATTLYKNAHDRTLLIFLNVSIFLKIGCANFDAAPISPFLL